MNYRNPAILRNAKHHSCQFCGQDDGTTVAAHSNQQRHGKGMGIKAHDCFIAYMCFTCHHEMDSGSFLTKRERFAMWEIAHQRSIPLFAELLGDEGHHVLEADGLGWEGLLS